MSHVLIVDDEKEFSATLQAFLETEGHTVRTVADGLAALQCLKKERPSVVILDVNLPELNGLEVLSQLRAAEPAVKVILISGFLNEETCELALSLGADACVQKPFKLTDLKMILDKR
jgi:DNA-binding response OmpR family regulator